MSTRAQYNSHGSAWAFWGGCSVFSISSPVVSGAVCLSAEAAVARVRWEDGLCDVELGSLADVSVRCRLPREPLTAYGTRACDGLLVLGCFSADVSASLPAVCRIFLCALCGFGVSPGFVVGSEVEAGDGAVHAVSRSTRPALRRIGLKLLLILYWGGRYDQSVILQYEKFDFMIMRYITI